MLAKEFKMGEVEIKLQPSNFDPWSDIEVVRELGCIYLHTESQMQPGEVVAEFEGEDFKPYSYMKLDPY